MFEVYSMWDKEELENFSNFISKYFRHIKKEKNEHLCTQAQVKKCYMEIESSAYLHSNKRNSVLRNKSSKQDE